MLNHYHVCRAFCMLAILSVSDAFYSFGYWTSPVMSTLCSTNLWRSFDLSQQRDKHCNESWHTSLLQAQRCACLCNESAKYYSTSSCIRHFPQFPGLPPSGNLLQQGDQERDRYWGEQRSIHGILVLSWEVEQRQHSRIEEGA